MKENNEKQLSKRFLIITIAFIAICAIIFVLLDVREYFSFVDKTPIPDEVLEAGYEIINLNTASAEELMTVEGIGPVTAEKIIAYRDKYGSFLSVEELTEISGIGENTLKRIKHRFTV